MTFPHIKELVQNAEDAGARAFKIFYKEGNPETHPRTLGSGYNRYFKVIEGKKSNYMYLLEFLIWCIRFCLVNLINIFNIINKIAERNPLLDIWTKFHL